MKYKRLSLITENQNTVEKAKRTGYLVQETLGPDWDFEVSRYSKFDHSYKIDFLNSVSEESSLEGSIALIDRICTPWLVSYDREGGGAEFIFNRTDHCRYRKQAFQVITWAIFTIGDN